MNTRVRPPRMPAGPARYEVLLGARIGDRWSRWFEGFELAELPDGTTRVVGAVADQPALFGLLNRVRDLNVPLLTVRRLETVADTAGRDGTTN